MEGTGYLTNIPLSKLALQVMLFPKNSAVLRGISAEVPAQACLLGGFQEGQEGQEAGSGPGECCARYLSSKPSLQGTGFLVTQ